MSDEAADDPLSRWLTDGVMATLDAITLEAPDIIGIMDRKLVVRYLNRTAPGLTREAVIGRSVLDLMPPDSREVARDAYAKVLRTGTHARYEAMFGSAADVRIWDVRAGPIRFENEIVGLIAIVSNVAEQRRAHADRDRFFSLSLDMLVVTSPNGHFKRANPAFGKALGYELTDLIGAPFIDFVHPDDRAKTVAAFESNSQGTPIIDFETRYRRRDGAYRVLSWRATVDPITADLYGVARDVTEHRATEVRLRHAQKMEAVGQLAGGVAHDFNNLLLAILANTELARDSRRGPAEVAEHLGEIEGAGRRAVDLTKQLLAFGRNQPFYPVPLDLNELNRGLMKMLQRLLPENISIDFIPGHQLASVSADPGQLEQVIVNLCVNARDAMEQGGRLTIETENIFINGRYCETHPWAKPGRYVLLTVTDTGAGMSSEVRERIFEPFFTTKGAQRGTGLGLSTVYGIVEQHDGMIHVYSELGQGTTFKLYLPADSRMAIDVGSKIEGVPPRGNETILLAEDDERVRRAVVRILERAGYRTLEASNGMDALRLLRDYEAAVHLVLLDVIMPEAGGPETWERMQGLRGDLRVLFTSGYADERSLKRLPPNAEILEKPFREEELLSRVRKKLDE